MSQEEFIASWDPCLARRLLKWAQISAKISRTHSDPSLSRQACEVLRYLWRRRAAPETFTAIARGWMLERGIAMIVRNLKRALDELVAANLVVQSRMAGGGVYDVNRRKMHRIQTLLAKQKGNEFPKKHGRKIHS